SERDLPLFVPGWEDSTLGNMFAAACTRGDCDPRIVKGGVEYMMRLIDWYSSTDRTARLGFFQIGGGNLGQFPIFRRPPPSPGPTRAAGFCGHLLPLPPTPPPAGPPPRPPPPH